MDMPPAMTVIPTTSSDLRHQSKSVAVGLTKIASRIASSQGVTEARQAPEAPEPVQAPQIERTAPQNAPQNAPQKRVSLAEMMARKRQAAQTPAPPVKPVYAGSVVEERRTSMGGPPKMLVASIFKKKK